MKYCKFIFFQHCECPHKETISTCGELVKIEFKNYQSGVGLKVSFKCGNKNLHAVIFQGNVLFDIMKKFEVGDQVAFKAILISSNGDHDLGKIFYIRDF